jgi:WD40 repeat protein
VVLWGVRPWGERARLAVPGVTGNTIAVSADEAQLATTDFERGVTVWDTSQGREKFTWSVQVVSSLAFAWDGTLLACAASDHSVRLWRPATGEEIGRFRGHEHNVNALAFSPDGRLLASGDYGGMVQLWDPVAQTPRATLTVSDGSLLPDEAVTLVFSHDGTRLTSGSYVKTVQLWDLTTLRRAGR